MNHHAIVAQELLRELVGLGWWRDDQAKEQADNLKSARPPHAEACAGKALCLVMVEMTESQGPWVLELPHSCLETCFWVLVIVRALAQPPPS
eukprot:1334746-Amphidinium_carterae.1